MGDSWCLNGRTTVYCCEENILDALRRLPNGCFSARAGSKTIDDVDEFAKEHPFSFFTISFRLRGGKGGFGTLLRSFRINKSTNQNMCRDLNGRRLVDVKEEEKLKKWIATASEREKEKEAKKKAKYEKLKAGAKGEVKHDFNDPEYIRIREEILDKTEDAFEAGFNHLKTKRKRKQPEPKEESDSSDDDAPGTSYDYMRKLMSKKKRKEEKEKVKKDTEGAAAEEETPSPPSQPEPVTEVNCEEPVEEEKPEKKKEEATAPAAPPSPPKAPAPPRSPPKAPAPPPSPPKDFAPVDLSEVESVVVLEELGLHHLKDALEKRGLKCGGSLAERAARLFSAKGLTPEQYPKNIIALPPKKKK